MSKVPPLVPEQIVVGALGATIVALAEGVRIATSDRAGALDTGPVALAMLHTIAFYLPAGLLVAAVSAALVALLRTSPALAPIRRQLGSPSLWFEPAPRAAGSIASAVAAAAVVALASRAAYEELATTTHRVDLAAWAMAGITIAALALAFLAAIAVRFLVARAARHLGPFASIGTFTVIGAIVLLHVAARWLAFHPEVVDAYAAALLLPPIALLGYACAFATARAAMRGASKRNAGIAGAAIVLASIGAWVASGRTYGAHNRVRALVEEETMGGRWLLRRYTRLTDLDGDRFSWGFGGRDCDDFDARVHPGALDEPGDGVDLDCFHGDGAPIVEAPGDGAYGVRPPAIPERPNIVLVTIDALRPDHLQSEGYERPVSPNIDRFAAQAVRFAEVLAPSSRSVRSIPAMWTGTHPSQVAFGGEFLFPSILPQNTTLAEALKMRGYRTGVTMGTDYFRRVGGFYQGFDDVEELDVYKPVRSVAADRAIVQLARLAQTGQPFFQWVHLFHVHLPYLRPPHPSRFGPRAIDAYDTEILLADEQFQRVLEAITAHGLDQSTIVVLASDHGEAFGEHGRTGHANTLYQEELLSVLMFRVPGIAPRRVETTVSLIDVTPTILNLVNVPVPRRMPARSLLPLMLGEPPRDRWFFAELLPDGMFPYDIKAIRHGRWKLHWWVQDGTIQLFDLENDPGELVDLSDARPERADELLGTLQAWSARTSRSDNMNEAFVARHRMRAPPPRMTHPLGLRYPGLFTVLGCDVSPLRMAPGQTLDVTCYYRVEGETDRDLIMMVDLRPQSGPPLPQHHARHVPLHGRYPTTQWRAGEILRDPSPIRFPDEIAVPSEFTLRFSVQDRRSRETLSFERGGRQEMTANITRIEVNSPNPGPP